MNNLTDWLNLSMTDASMIIHKQVKTFKDKMV